MSGQLKWSIIKRFLSKNSFGFKFQDVVREFPGKNPSHLARTLTAMVGEGMLSKITRDTYLIIPPQADPETYVPDGLQVAKYIMRNKEYYIGYGSASKIHGLTLQINETTSNSETGVSGCRVYVVTKKQMKPAIRTFRGITYQFIKHQTIRFFGFESMWINQYEQVLVSDLEKTIVDSLIYPRFCGGIGEVGKALFHSKNRTDHDKMFYYLARHMNKSSKKRFLFLTDLLGMDWTTDHERMMKDLGTSISLLDSAGLDQGLIRRKFGLKINFEPNELKNKVLR
jgi:predicted transcriptional regulator of viral defense system